MDYGHFSEDGREFIITRPDTPRPWINCLTNGTYGALVSQTGGGYSFIGGPGYDRITRANPDIAVFDRPGRYIYVRDNSSGEFFSIGWQPTKRKPDWFKCRHAPGRTTVASTNHGITGRITYFVPLNDNLEVWRITLENLRDEPVDLSIFTYVEWVLGNFAEDFDDRQMSVLFNQVRFEDNAIVAGRKAWRRPDLASVVLKEIRSTGGPKFVPETLSANQSWGKYAFIALTIPVVGFDCDRQAFLGRYGELSRPQAVVKGECSNSEADGRDAVGVLQSRLAIRPHDKVEFDIILGIALHAADPSGIVARYSERSEVDEKLNAVIRYWDEKLDLLTAKTPDPDINRSINVWDKYQALISSELPGMPSFYRGGASVIGFRESCFDLQVVMPMDIDLAARQTGQLIKHQFNDGSTMHNWEMRSDAGTRTGHLDDPIWLVLTIIDLIKETGEPEFLDEKIPYYYSRNPATVYEHLIRALDFCLSQLTNRGLARLGPGDWNETLDQAGRDGLGESVLTSQMLCHALLEAAELAKRVGDGARAKIWRQHARQLRHQLNDLAWDGAWYIRAIGDDGNVIGGKSNTSGRIYSEPQSWAVISGIASQEQAFQSMESFEARLDTPYGPALVSPAYQKSDSRIGTITRLTPGLRQNGGISTIAACWAVMAECILGRGDRAYKLLQNLLQTARPNQERYKAEPYVRSEFIEGPSSASPGSGGFTWSAGVGAWVWKTNLDWICGVRADYDGLKIDPCVPSTWESLSIKRPFREAVYQIEVENPDHVQKGVVEVTVDGKKVRPTGILPDFQDEKTHEVHVVMGDLA